MKNNPYSLVFGKEPNQLISRAVPSTEVITAFTSDTPSQQIYIITGIRGCGKTVLMTTISRKIAKKTNWITVELNPERDMLTSLASKLYNNNILAPVFQEARINLSFFGIGIEVAGARPITDIETALSKMLESLKRHGKRVLITIDEASNTQNMRVFAAAFQIFVRQDLPIFVLMTGLYENIHGLQNQRSLTFLYRAPKIELGPLNITTIAKNYRKNCKVTDEEAVHMAKMTRGYSFAFQVLGYFVFEQGAFTKNAVSVYREYLEDYVYEKVWDELSGKDKEVVYGIAKTPSGRVNDVRALLHMETNQFNPYRKRLIKKGIIEGKTYGYVHFQLPFFENYAIQAYEQY